MRQRHRVCHPFGQTNRDGQTDRIKIRHGVRQGGSLAFPGSEPKLRRRHLNRPPLYSRCFLDNRQQCVEERRRDTLHRAPRLILESRDFFYLPGEMTRWWRVQHLGSESKSTSPPPTRCTQQELAVHSVSLRLHLDSHFNESPARARFLRVHVCDDEDVNVFLKLDCL